MESHSWPRFRVNFDGGVGGIIRKLVLREMNMEMGSINLEKSPNGTTFWTRIGEMERTAEGQFELGNLEGQFTFQGE